MGQLFSSLSIIHAATTSLQSPRNPCHIAIKGLACTLQSTPLKGGGKHSRLATLPTLKHDPLFEIGPLVAIN